jgi:hypothetical protein
MKVELELHHAVPFGEGSLRLCDGSRNGRICRRRESIYKKHCRKKLVKVPLEMKLN